MHYLPLVLDVMIPLAEPRPRKLLIVFEIFLDKQKYFHLIMLYMLVMGFFCVTAMIATETIMMAMLQHVCGLLKVAR